MGGWGAVCAFGLKFSRPPDPTAVGCSALMCPESPVRLVGGCWAEGTRPMTGVGFWGVGVRQRAGGRADTGSPPPAVSGIPQRRVCRGSRHICVWKVVAGGRGWETTRADETPLFFPSQRASRFSSLKQFTWPGGETSASQENPLKRFPNPNTDAWRLAICPLSFPPSQP